MEKAIRCLERACLVLAVISATTIMLLVSYDAIVRYVTNRPTPWSFQLISYYLLVCAFFPAISATYQNGDHIALDLFRTKFPPLLRRLSDFFWAFLGAGTVALISYGAWDMMLHAYSNQEFLPGHIIWPVWLTFVPVALGSGVFALRLLKQCYTLIFDDQAVAVKFDTETAK